MIVGFDFDNTIICYDGVFYDAAREQGLVPDTIATDKTAVRDYLRSAGKEKDWTVLQGYVYGVHLRKASVFPDVISCLQALNNDQIDWHIISHKTRFPYLGPKYDLHAAAREWIDSHLATHVAIPQEHIHLCESKDEKLARISELGCTHFVDDLPEFLTHPDFPNGVTRILFAPHGTEDPGFTTCRSWQEIAEELLST